MEEIVYPAQCSACVICDSFLPSPQDQNNMYRSFDDSQIWAMTRLSGRVKQSILVHECQFTPTYWTGWSMNTWTFKNGMKNCDGVSLLWSVHAYAGFVSL